MICPGKMSGHETARLEMLGNAVHGIARPFVCGGSFLPREPVTLRLKDGEIVFKKRGPGAGEDSALKTFLSRCQAAPFGKGSKTLYNPRVRDALELRAEGSAFAVHGFDPAESGVLKEVQEKLCPDDTNSLLADLYNLNVYGPGGHFVPHKDTPRGNDMVGTLVVCLPTSFYGGNLVVSHAGARKVFDWGKEISRQEEPSRIHWAAFFGDVDHSIREVLWGHRITLTYVLRRGEGASRASAPTGTISERLKATFEDALRDARFFARGVTLGFPCFHMYSKQATFQNSRMGRLTRETLHKLKGRDYNVAATAMEAGLSVTLEPYLIESCGGETWRLKGFPSTAKRRLLGDRLTPSDLEEALSISAHSEEDADLGVTWVIAPPGVETPLEVRTDQSATEAEPRSELLHSCEYSPTGYFGNEGSESDFYLYAALHVVIPPFGESARRGSKLSTKTSRGLRKGARRRGA